MRSFALLFPIVAATATPLSAQHHPSSPYVDLQSREIKALAPEEITGLLAGEGLGFALPAELNGLPGPKHVLELADSLGLSSDQVEEVQDVSRRMQTTARALGARLVEAERALDRLFAQGRPSEEAVRKAVAEAGVLRAELRAAHLVAHVATAAILTSDQIHGYRRLRGYHAGEAR